MIIIYRKELQLFCSKMTPAEGSANVVAIIHSAEDDMYSDYAVTELKIQNINGTVGNCQPVQTNKFIIPSSVFSSDGYISLSCSLEKGTERLITHPLVLKIQSAPNGGEIIPSSADWQTLVRNYVAGIAPTRDEFNAHSTQIANKVGYAEYSNSYLDLYSDNTKTNRIAHLLIEGESGGSGISESRCKEIIESYGYVTTATFTAHTHSYNDLTNKPTIPSKTSDLTNDSGFLSEHQSLDGYVQKEQGKSLISDTEIERLANVENYDDTELKEDIVELKEVKHSHANKSVLDSVTQSKVTEWDNKANASDIPTKTSDLTNDSGFLTEHQDISGKQNATDNSLSTTSKTIVGAINELKDELSGVGDLADGISEVVGA